MIALGGEHAQRVTSLQSVPRRLQLAKIVDKITRNRQQVHVTHIDDVDGLGRVFGYDEMTVDITYVSHSQPVQTFWQTTQIEHFFLNHWASNGTEAHDNPNDQ
nr:hypothetical protein [Pseudomonas viridiflava]